MGQNGYSGKFILVLFTIVRNGNQPQRPTPGDGLDLTARAALPVRSKVGLQKATALNNPRLPSDTRI